MFFLFRCRKGSSASVFFPFLSLVLVMTSCTDQKSERQMVARVNDSYLTEDMMHEALDSISMNNRALKSDYTTQWINAEMLYLEAQQRGIDKSDVIEKKVDKARRQLVIAQLLEDEVYTKSRTLTTGEIVKYYDEHRGTFTLDHTLLYLSIAVFSSQDRSNAFRASALSTSGWSETAAQLNQYDTTLLSFEDSIFHTQSSLYPPELWKVASILGKGEVSFPIKTSVGYFVIRLIGQYPRDSVAPLDYVKNEIREQLTLDHRQQLYTKFFESLRRKYSIQVMRSTTDTSLYQKVN